MELDSLPPDDPSIQPELGAVIWLGTSLSGVVMLLRIYGKIIQRQRLWWDDYIFVITWLAILVDAVFATLLLGVGLGKHIANVSPPDLVTFALYSTIASTLSIFATGFSKVAFAVTLLKFARGWIRLLLLFVAYLLCIESAVAAVCLWIRCIPVEKVWLGPSIAGACWSAEAAVGIPIFNTALNGLLDVLLTLLPWVMLEDKTRQALKTGDFWGMMFCTFLGLFAAVSGFAKTALMHVLVGSDVTAELPPLFSWGVTEPVLIVVAASLPELRLLIWRYAKTAAPKYFLPLETEAKDTTEMERSSLPTRRVPPSWASSSNLTEASVYYDKRWSYEGRAKSLQAAPTYYI